MNGARFEPLLRCRSITRLENLRIAVITCNMISITRLDVTKLALRAILEDVKRAYNSVKLSLLNVQV